MSVKGQILTEPIFELDISFAQEHFQFSRQPADQRFEVSGCNGRDCDRGSAVWGLDSGTAATAPLADKRQGGPNVSFVQNF